AQAKQIAALTSELDRLAKHGPSSSGGSPQSGPKDGDPKEVEAEQCRERIEMLCQTIQNLDGDRDKECIEGLQAKVKETREQLQRLKPQITQHTNAGHLLAELERKRMAALQKKKEQEELITAAQLEIGKQDAAVAKFDVEIVEAKRALASTIPDDVFFDCDETDFVDDQEVRDMFASAAWERYHDKVKEKGGEEPDDKDVETLWQATKGEKRNLLEQSDVKMSKEEPVFRFYFANITSYGDKFKDQIRTWSKGTWLEESGPHLVGFVEHHMMGPKLTEAKKGLRRQGWRGDFVRAQPAIN
ncbi:unnamed protein product, partial [Prorocentrum cordatum]